MDDLTNIFQNVALSALWGVNFFILASRDLPPESAFVAGLLAFVTVLATLWLIVEREFSPDTATLIKAVLWGAGMGHLGLLLCLLLFQVVPPP